MQRAIVIERYNPDGTLTVREDGETRTVREWGTQHILSGMNEFVLFTLESNTVLAWYSPDPGTVQTLIGEYPPDTGLDVVVSDAARQYPVASIALAIVNDWLTPAEVAAATDTAESGWRNKAAAGEIPGAVKKGKQWLLLRSVLRAQGVKV